MYFGSNSIILLDYIDVHFSIYRKTRLTYTCVDSYIAKSWKWIFNNSLQFSSFFFNRPLYMRSSYHSLNVSCTQNTVKILYTRSIKYDPRSLILLYNVVLLILQKIATWFIAVYIARTFTIFKHLFQ